MINLPKKSNRQKQKERMEARLAKAAEEKIAREVDAQKERDERKSHMEQMVQQKDIFTINIDIYKPPTTERLRAMAKLLARALTSKNPLDSMYIPNLYKLVTRLDDTSQAKLKTFIANTLKDRNG